MLEAGDIEQPRAKRFSYSFVVGFFFVTKEIPTRRIGRCFPALVPRKSGHPFGLLNWDIIWIVPEHIHIHVHNREVKKDLN